MGIARSSGAEGGRRATVLPARRSFLSRLEQLGPPSWPVVLLVLCCWNGLLAVLLGKDINWDLLNYHFYNGYAFLTGRLDLDVAPAQTQTFFNPLLDVPLYLAIVSLPPIVVGAAYGFVQGLNGVAVWLIGLETLPVEGVGVRGWSAFSLAFLGGLGAINVGELGGSMGDTLVSIPVLFSVALLLRKQRHLETASYAVVMAWTGLAGAISGIASGLKLIAVLYSAGFAFGCLFLVRDLGRTLLVTVAFGAGAVASWLLLSGFWLWRMWSRFGEPLFPYFSLFGSLSRSAFAGVAAATDNRFLPTSGIRAALYPLVWTANPSVVAEMHFRDWRFSILYLLLAFLAIRWCVVRRWGQACATRPSPTGARAFLLVGGLAAYVLWLLWFGYYRYLAPLEWLVPLAITLALWALVPQRYRIVAVVAVLVLTTITTKPMDLGRAGWTRSYFGVVAPKLEGGASSLVLIAGLNGLSFIVPHLPKGMRVVRLQSNSYLYGMALGGVYGRGSPPNQFDTLVEEALASHQGNIYVMFDGADASPGDRSNLAGAYELDSILWKLDLRLRADSCQPVGILETPPPPWSVVWRGYVQRPLMPAVTICSVIRGPARQEVAGRIARLYFAYFHRLPDRAQLGSWITQYKAGKSLVSISEVFASSPEFRTTYGSLTNEQFVTRVYQNVLGRDPDPGGLAYWVGQLNTGAAARGQVMLAFSESPEYNLTSSSPGGGGG